MNIDFVQNFIHDLFRYLLLGTVITEVQGSRYFEVFIEVYTFWDEFVYIDENHRDPPLLAKISTPSAGWSWNALPYGKENYVVATPQLNGS